MASRRMAWEPKRWIRFSRDWQPLTIFVWLSGAVLFVLLATVIIAFDGVFPNVRGAPLRVGDIAQEDIRASATTAYMSDVLTGQRRQAALESISPIYDPPDPTVSRQQIALARQILDTIDNIRSDPLSTTGQKTADLGAITALTLDGATVQSLLAMDDDTWRAVDDEIIAVIERVMRESIRQSDLQFVIDTLPTQVSVRFDAGSLNSIVSIVGDLLRPNRLPNPEATALARETAVDAVPLETRSFERGQIVVRAGTRIDAADFEALSRLGLITIPDQRVQQIAQALLASILVLAAGTLYFLRCQPEFAFQRGFLPLLMGVFLLTLLGARFFAANNEIYLYPAAALALIVVALANTEIAFVSVLGLALLCGVMLGSSLEVAALIGAGGMLGALTMRASERLNSYFFSGLVIGLSNIVVIALFNLENVSTLEVPQFTLTLVYGLLNGLIAAMAALAGIFIITLLFNLPTSLKLVELSQPNQKLLQRLLREAPGTYQHSLQVSNLCEQAATAIGANADLVRIAALYHDIGKVLNPAFFIENQADGVNPHDVLNDPYRSAAIIIAHVVDGEKLARQYRLPGRIRDFILEHHGTTLVGYFYNQAVLQTDDAESVDADPFRYPGPKPHSRETAVMMLADTCESTVRARKPANKAEIAEIVGQIIESRMRDGQLYESGLTLNDLETVRVIFIEMLQSVFHPRINYPAFGALTRAGDSLLGGKTVSEARAYLPATLTTIPMPGYQVTDTINIRTGEEGQSSGFNPAPRTPPGTKPVSKPKHSLTQPMEVIRVTSDEEEAPLLEVPPLRRATRVKSDDGVQVKPAADAHPPVMEE